MVKLADPERCEHCGGRGRVVQSRKRRGYRRRVHQCRTCKRTWESYQSRFDPRRVRKITRVAGREATAKT